MNANKSYVIHRRPYYTVKTGGMVNNISVISWWSDSLVEETEAPGENHRLECLFSHTVYKITVEVVKSVPHYFVR
jgi:hypothetical protein